MIFIGEKINGMFSTIRKAIEERNSDIIIKEAEKQLEAGADYLDVNVGTAKDKIEAMKWLVNTIQQIPNVKLCIDSPNAEVLEEGIKLCKNRPFLNSVSAEQSKIEKIMPIAQKYNTKLIALAISENGVPADSDEIIANSAIIMEATAEYGIKNEDLYIDPVVLPVNVSQDNPRKVLTAISAIKELDIPAPRTIVGLSNISQKCSDRKIINRTFLAMAKYAGLDAAIVDACDEELMKTNLTSEILLNQTIYCDSFLKK